MALDELNEDDIHTITEEITFVMSLELIEYGDLFTLSMDSNGECVVTSDNMESC